MDWVMLPQSFRVDSPVPIVNLIQHVRHGVPQDDRFAFLSYRAIRICVSNEVAEAIQNTKRVKGPIYAIPNGLDVSGFPTPNSLQNRAYDIFVGGVKAPDVAMHLHEKLRDTGVKIKVVTEFLPRNSYLELINNAKVAVLLPNRTEGFFLPALEAMALETIVICPDCIGNRRFCIDGRNCFRPNYTIEDIAAAVKKALSLDTETREQLLVNATRTRLDHSLERERDAFLLILENLEKVWGGLRRDKGRSDVNG
jgi:hypothetical protein